MNQIRIPFSGTHNAGKTTTIYGVASRLKQLGFESVDVLPEVARYSPYPISKDASYETALWIMLHQIQMEYARRNTEILLLDRCILDEVAYWKYQCRHSDASVEVLSKQNAFLTRLATLWLDANPIDLLIQFKPRSLIDDGERDVDPVFQKSIDEIFTEVLKVYGDETRVHHSMSFGGVEIESAINMLCAKIIRIVHAKRAAPQMMSMKPPFKLVYISYPYTDNPYGRAIEVKLLVRDLLALRCDIIPIVPHYVFDALFDFPAGYTHPEFGAMELEVINRCDAITSPPPITPTAGLGGGVRWENAFVEWLQSHGHAIKQVEWHKLFKGEKI